MTNGNHDTRKKRVNKPYLAWHEAVIAPEVASYPLLPSRVAVGELGLLALLPGLQGSLALHTGGQAGDLTSVHKY